jgi:hypothetical protein
MSEPVEDQTQYPTPIQTAKINTMARLGEKLPEGTRIVTTQGGMPTGGTHEVDLEMANKVSEFFTDPRPFWCYGWRDLHSSLILPNETEEVEPAEDQTTLDAWERLWPQSGFKNREDWLSYCRTWWPKVPSLVAALDSSKARTASEVDATDPFNYA